MFTLSGFGAFGSVLNNPTMEIIRSITEDEKFKYNILICDVLEVSAVGCQNYINDIKNIPINKIESDC